MTEPCGYCGKDPCSASSDFNELIGVPELAGFASGWTRYWPGDVLPAPVPRQRGLAERQPGPEPEQVPDGWPLDEYGERLTVGRIMRRYKAAIGEYAGAWNLIP